MEKDGLIGHGIARFLNEKLLHNSDAFATYVCNTCGLFAYRKERPKNEKKPQPHDIYYCRLCNDYNNIGKVVIPYALKLLLQELYAMNVLLKLKLE